MKKKELKKRLKLSGAELRWNYKERASLMWQVMEKPKNFLSASTN
jgi:hypothetical protein